MDDFDTEAVRSAVHKFYSEKKYPTMDSLLSEVKEKGIFSGEHTTLWRVMRKMGFMYKKVMTSDIIIYSQTSLIRAAWDRGVPVSKKCP